METHAGLSDVLPYPDILSLPEMPPPPGDSYYLIRQYPLCGLSVLVSLQQQGINIRVADWDGNVLDLAQTTGLASLAREFLGTCASKLSLLVRTTRVQQALFYFSLDNSGFRLVDVRTSVNQFCSPGMIRDVFGRIFPTQEIIDTRILDNEFITGLVAYAKGFDSSLIIKPSKFKTIQTDKGLLPLYVKVDIC